MSKTWRKSGRHDLCQTRRGSVRAARRYWNHAQRRADHVRLAGIRDIGYDEDSPEAPRRVDPWSLPSDGKTWDNTENY